MRTPDTAAGYSREWPASVRSWNGMNSDGNIDIGPRCWCWCPFLELQEFYYRLPWRLNAPTMTTKFRDMQHCCTMCFKTVFWSVYCIFRFIWEIYKLAGMTHNAGVSPWKRPGVIWGRCELMWTLRFGELKDSVARCMFIRDWGLFPKPDPMAIAVMGKTCQHSHHRDRITCTYFDLLNWTNECKWIGHRLLPLPVKSIHPGRKIRFTWATENSELAGAIAWGSEKSSRKQSQGFLAGAGALGRCESGWE